jgi:hypothetical protein
MTQGTLVIASLAAGIAGAAYAVLALRLLRDARPRGVDASVLGSFALWWGTLAGNILLVALTYVLAAFGALPFGAQLAASVLERILLGVGVAGLLRYLLYLRTGRDFALALRITYGAYLALALLSLYLARPDGAFVGQWRTELTYAGASPSWGPALNALIVLPSLVAAGAYFLLYFRADDAPRRYRIAVVSWAVIAWWALAIVAGQPALLDVGWLQVVNRGSSVITALLVYWGHHPPGWLASRIQRAPRRGARPQEGSP